ncbi:hypothetical protein BDV95DRAFT_486560 [Massariosphaeria phaeospora]|uniref:Uncharacterized protein n=1 Tax=Massariosphaeria phaeospora TaxID=100035 RepID=A0A7C8MK41_9PLEO|nr:hypothetical protein BDV95DRAFT_486560 [Massariosphaeria phaeospora]
MAQHERRDSYVDCGTQTVLAGLTRDPNAHPAALGGAASTSPADVEKPQTPTGSTPAITKSDANDPQLSPTLLQRRKSTQSFTSRLQMPDPEFDTQDPRSPPPTQGILSPLPLANTLHAGHTPIVPRSLSPLSPLGRRDEEEPSGSETPVQENILQGALVLPPAPGDGAADRIDVDELSARLEQVAKENELADEREEAPLSPMVSHSTSDAVTHSRKGSTEGHRRPSADDAGAVDGVLLKQPKMNMGAPFGKA